MKALNVFIETAAPHYTHTAQALSTWPVSVLFGFMHEGLELLDTQVQVESPSFTV
ncbi:MAG TPA: hypothetical protein VF602_07540 [Pedobacter sp.]|jgi:hypothetical protein